MINMYLAEVLNKLPVVQHFCFGSILTYDGPAPPTMENEDDAYRDHGHVHGVLGGDGETVVASPFPRPFRLPRRSRISRCSGLVCGLVTRGYIPFRLSVPHRVLLYLYFILHPMTSSRPLVSKQLSTVFQCCRAH